MNQAEILQQISLKNFSKRKRRFLVLDLETIASEDNPQIYSWGIVDEKFNYTRHIDQNILLDFINDYKTNVKIYTNNGAKFDDHFIIPLLSDYGFRQKVQWVDNVTEYPPIYGTQCVDQFKRWWKDAESSVINATVSKLEILTELYKIKYDDLLDNDAFELLCYLIEQEPSLKNHIFKYSLLPNEYMLTTDKNYKVFEIKICNSLGKIVTIRDAILLFGGSIKKKGETLNKMFNCDYFTKREKVGGYLRTELYSSLEEWENDGNEVEYLYYDLLILMVFLLKMDEEYDRKNWQLTAAKTAYQNWKYGYFLVDRVQELIKSGQVEIKTQKRGMRLYRLNLSPDKKGTWVRLKGLKNQLFKKLFLAQEEIFNDLYNYFVGGLAYPEPRNVGIAFEETNKYDIISSYPAAMKQQRIPFGEIFVGNKKGCDFKFYRITAKTNLINKEGIPFIKVKNKYNSFPYLRIIPNGNVFYLTSIELPNFKKYYEGKYYLEITYSSATVDGEWLFGSFIDYWFGQKAKAKANGNKVLEAIAKLMLNSLYGKFGTKRLRTSRYWLEDEKIWIKVEGLTENEYYLPFAIAITAWGRTAVVNFIGYNCKMLKTVDTDSAMFPRRFHDQLKGLGNQLGQWKLEIENMTVIVRRKKQYLEFWMDDNGLKKYGIAYASINMQKVDLAKLSFNDFIYGTKIPEQLRPKRNTPFGIFLEEYEKEIVPLWSKNYTHTDEGLDLWYKDEASYTELVGKITKVRKQEIVDYKWK